MTSDVRAAFSEALALFGGAPADVAAGRMHAEAVDAILVRLFAEATNGDDDGVAVVAVGGYGRRELAPYSDLDVMLVHRGRTDEDVERVNNALLYPLWDAGRDVGNRVRDLRDVVRSLDRVDESTAVLDARLLAGDRAVFVDLQAAVLRRLQRARASFFRRLLDETAARRDRFGHAGHVLEPNVRDSAGGLRDVQTLAWAAAVASGSPEVSALVDAGYVTTADAEALEAAYGFLFGVRVAAHRVSGRRQDVLLLHEQDDVAAMLSYPGDASLHPGDALMRDVHRVARDVEAIVTATWERLTHRRGRRPFRPAARSVGDGCIVQDGRLEVVAAPSPRDDPSGWLLAFRHAAVHGVSVGRASLARLRDTLGDAEPRWNERARETFLDLLRRGEGATAALEAMGDVGLLGALVPEWRHVRALPQRNPYHRFTVDVHLFRTVAELAASRSSSQATVRDAWSRVHDGDALALAALLHDVGKGRGGDHAAVGARLARSVCLRLGLDDERADLVVSLVAEHLTLAEAATHRDLNDERTVAHVVARVVDASRLAMLYLLTRADSLATGPEAWSTFRASLVAELYGRALAVLGVGEHPAARRDERVRRIVDSAAGVLDAGDAARLVGELPASWLDAVDPQRAVHHLELIARPPARGEVRSSLRRGSPADELVVVAHDRPGLFATVSGVLAARGADVRAAEVYTTAGGLALEVYHVVSRTPSHDAKDDVDDERWTAIRADLEAAVRGALDVEAALARRSAQLRTAAGRRLYRPLQPGRWDAVLVDADASDRYTVVEVRGTDRVGLLHDVAKALADVGCDIAVAKAATYGAEAVDVFYVRDVGGGKLGADAARVLEATLRRVVSQPAL